MGDPYDQHLSGISAARVPLTYLDRVIGYADVALTKSDEDELWEPLKGGYYLEISGTITEESAKSMFNAFTIAGLSIDVQPQPVFPKEGENDAQAQGTA